MTSTKIQINYKIQKFNACTEHSRSNQNSFGHLKIDIWILFVFCFLLFGALLQKCLTLLPIHYLYFKTEL